MARRKRVLDDDDDSDSSVGSYNNDVDFDNDPDAREERALFEDPYQRKRRRKDGKEDALYGVFADDSEDDTRKPAAGGGGKKAKRSDWTKAPAFVSGVKVDLDTETAMDVDKDSDDNDSDEEDGNAGFEGEGEGEDEEEYSDNSEPSRRPSPRIREEEDQDDPDEKPRMGGIGLGASAFSKGGIGSRNASSATSSSPFAKGGIGASRTAASRNDIAFSASSTEPSTTSTKGGIGSKPSTSKPTPTPIQEDTPSSFGNSRSTSFVRDAKPPPRAAPLSAAEQAHFNKLSGSFGARMLQKMGWQAGTGLGTTGEGIVTPVESKLRPERVGIAFRGLKERTEQSKNEARRRGEVVSDDEDVKVRKARKKENEAKTKRSDAWKRPKKVKVKVEHKTYEQIVAEAEAGSAASSGLGQIIDATGAVPREISSLADISLNSWTPSTDPTRIPEVRHNIRLIADACKADLDGLAREAKALDERKKFVAQEDLRLRKKVEEEADLIARLQQVQLVTSEISAKSNELSTVYEVSLEPLSPLIYKLYNEHSKEYARYRLDEIVVAAIAPLVRRMVAQWDPLADPTAFIPTFRNWRGALRVNVQDEEPPKNQVDVYGTTTIAAPVLNMEKPMTPFESLLWNVWLPKVRTCINNEWHPQIPQPAVKLYETWSTFLPPFIRDNLLDQLILPKVHKAVAEWKPKQETVSLQAIVFPWLPHVGLRLEDVVGDARRKVKSLLRAWVVGEDPPADLLAWKDVFDAADWESILLKYVVPKLGATLRNDFRINPRNQNMEPLQHVLKWADLIRPSIFSQILETEFFPKWLDVLHVWLIQPKVSFEEVAQWYSFWKTALPEKVQDMPGVSRGFTRGLQLMNTAIELGPEAPTRLPRPEFRAEQAPGSPRNGTTPKANPRPSARTHEITFRSIVEEFAAAHNLLFIPTGRAHELSRMPLFKVSPSADGKGGLLVYILDDAVWAPVDAQGDDYRAISLDDMVARAVI